MSALKKIPFDLSTIAEVFKLERNSDSQELKNWLNHEYELSKVKLDLLGKVHQEMVIASDYLNEEEIKIRLIAHCCNSPTLIKETKFAYFLSAA